MAEWFLPKPVVYGSKTDIHLVLQANELLLTKQKTESGRLVKIDCSTHCVTATAQNITFVPL